MVSYYNSLSYSQKHHATNLTYPTSAHQAWFPANYHAHTAAAAANQQFLNGMSGPPDHATHLNHQHQAAAAAAMYYNSHMFHQAPPPPHDLYGARENFQNFTTPTATAVHHLPPPPSATSSSAFHYPHHSHTNGLQSNGQYYQSPHLGIRSCSSGGSPLDETSSSADILAEGIPSPPNTTGSGGSGINSPGVPNASSSPQIPNRNTPITNICANNNNNQNNHSNNNFDNDHIDNDDDDDDQHHDNVVESKLKTQLELARDREYYDWMKKPQYPSQPNPGKTRTKDKYRVVYTDFQRLELEKEYHTSRYITIRRKTELAQCLQLSERQVKIWFQNRRAKERKIKKKCDDPVGVMGREHQNTMNGLTNSVADDLANFLDIKTKTEPNDYPHNSYHSQLCSVSMGPPPPPNMLNPFPVLPPTSAQHAHQGHHHLGMSPVGSNGMTSSHAYSQMLQNMIEPIP